MSSRTTLPVVLACALVAAAPGVADEPLAQRELSPLSAERRELPAVILLPLMPEGIVSQQHADGVTDQLRLAVTDEVARLLSASREDTVQALRCARDIACLTELAELRGADLLASGIATPAPDGLRIALTVVRASKSDPARRVEATLRGDGGDALRLERLAREAFNPAALRGAILVEGEAGAAVAIDGEPQGTLPLPGPITGIVEGHHTVTVTKEGYADYSRSVAVTHRETTTVKAVLLGADTTWRESSPASGSGPPTAAIIAGALGGGLLLAGGVVGGFALKDSLDIEARAEAQQLAFPQDQQLFARGQVLSWTANGLYLGAAVALGTAAAVWLTSDDRAASPSSSLASIRGAE